jgi:uncharacterized membrane protein YphA (DoxX/SURF4 family)
LGVVVFVLRLLVGGLFLVAGALKVGHADFLAATIAGFRLVPASIIAPMSLFLPFFEIGLGAYLIVGLFTRAAAIVATTQLVVFAAAIASVVARHITISCGCFGPTDTAVATWFDVFRDLVAAAIAATIAIYAPGRFAVDSRGDGRPARPGETT